MGRIPHRPGGPWTGILLAASVLGSCLQPAPAQTPVSIVLTPPSPAVGGGVSLAPQNPPQDFLSCSWYRSATTDETSRILTYFPGPSTDQTGPAHTGRETAGPGCALHIAGLTLNVTGSYAVKIEPRTSAVTITVHLPVSDGTDSARIDPPEPIDLTLGSPLTLSCVADSVPAPSYCWVLNGTNTNETGTSLTFNPTTLDHQGTYECQAHNPVTNRTARASVAVRVTGTGESPGWKNALQTQGSQCWHQCPSAALGAQAAGSGVGGLLLTV
ncbi:putative pregnancy-specific beta-1-glycoprotein 7 isoform X1 [Chelonia mydas]|uniref:putative pregnancy-specific beta-1-glycoprotein 7 isoform X1 n=1 Tax=Chelonia mydas TaxID=8469 RepID=UPI001CA8E75E|nr:putative pregnancy-specific beta-1-glycoprotein 7 isoform X1 [Chelonia mydas]